MLPPVAVGCTCLSLRVVRPRAFTLEELIAAGTVPPIGDRVLRALMEARLSFLVSGGTVNLRIIDAEITMTCSDGTVFTGSYRLVTTLTDARRHSARALINLYHERWEHESTYFALRHTILAGPILENGQGCSSPRSVRSSTEWGGVTRSRRPLKILLWAPGSPWIAVKCQSA